MLVTGLLITGLLVDLILAALWTGTAIPWFRPQVTIVGIVLILLGTALRWWPSSPSGATSSSTWRCGPRNRLCNPGRIASCGILLGIGLALENWASLVVLLACGLIGLLYRVRVEEHAFKKALGQLYVDYMRHIKRFTPFVF